MSLDNCKDYRFCVDHNFSHLCARIKCHLSEFKEKPDLYPTVEESANG